MMTAVDSPRGSPSRVLAIYRKETSPARPSRELNMLWTTVMGRRVGNPVGRATGDCAGRDFAARVGAGFVWTPPRISSRKRAALNTLATKNPASPAAPHGPEIWPSIPTTSQTEVRDRSHATKARASARASPGRSHPVRRDGGVQSQGRSASCNLQPPCQRGPSDPAPRAAPAVSGGVTLGRSTVSDPSVATGQAPAPYRPPWGSVIDVQLRAGAREIAGSRRTAWTTLSWAWAEI